MRGCEWSTKFCVTIRGDGGVTSECYEGEDEVGDGEGGVLALHVPFLE